VRGELGGAEKKNFELHFVAHPERRDRVEFARTLNQYLLKHSAVGPAAADRSQAVRHTGFSAPGRAATALAACLLLFLASGAALLWRQSRHLQDQIQQVELQRSQSEQHQQELLQQIEQQVAQNSALTAQFERQEEELNRLRRELARLLPERTDSTMASLLLAPGISRAPGQANSVDLSPSTQKLRLNLQVDGERYKTYIAEVQTVEGSPVVSQADLKSHTSGNNRVVTLVLATAPLIRSDYLVMLDGMSESGSREKVSTYYFKLVRRD
jgi:hypothetical protein